jgi:hypothetical protein
MIENITSQVSYVPGKPLTPSQDPTEKRVRNDADVTLQVSFSDLIDKAKQPSADEAVALEEAKQLLLSGQLTNRENVEAAAKNMLTLGI